MPAAKGKQSALVLLAPVMLAFAWGIPMVTWFIVRGEDVGGAVVGASVGAAILGPTMTVLCGLRVSDRVPRPHSPEEDGHDAVGSQQFQQWLVAGVTFCGVGGLEGLVLGLVRDSAALAVTGLTVLLAAPALYVLLSRRGSRR